MRWYDPVPLLIEVLTIVAVVSAIPLLYQVWEVR